MSAPQIDKPLLVTFSGLDGAGKSTQIAELRQAVSLLGLHSQLITFWDDVVVARRWRQDFVNKVLGSEQGIGSPGRPVERRDKNVRSAYLTLIRHLLYLADAVHLRILIRRALAGTSQVIIMDRYIYDELANLPLENAISSAYAKLLARISPRPALALLLDADPESARARKPEYPVSFLRQSRRAYFRLARILGVITIIPPLTLDDAKRAVLANFLRALGRTQQENSSAAGAAPAA